MPPPEQHYNMDASAPQNDRELILRVDGEVRLIKQEVQSMNANLVDAVNGMKEVLKSLEDGKLNDHHNRILKLETWKTEKDGKDKFIKAVITIIGLVVAAITFVLTFIRIKI